MKDASCLYKLFSTARINFQKFKLVYHDSKTGLLIGLSINNATILDNCWNFPALPDIFIEIQHGFVILHD